MLARTTQESPLQGLGWKRNGNPLLGYVSSRSPQKVIAEGLVPNVDSVQCSEVGLLAGDWILRALTL